MGTRELTFFMLYIYGIEEIDACQENSFILFGIYVKINNCILETIFIQCLLLQIVMMAA